jgi:hypothetical protein
MMEDTPKRPGFMQRAGVVVIALIAYQVSSSIGLQLVGKGIGLFITALLSIIGIAIFISSGAVGAITAWALSRRFPNELRYDFYVVYCLILLVLSFAAGELTPKIVPALSAAIVFFITHRKKKPEAG